MEVDAPVDPQAVSSSSSSSQAPSPPPTPSRKRSLDSVVDDAAADENGDGGEDGGRSAKKAKRVPVDGDKFADDLALELQCGCCTGLCYNPVVVQPCQHFFCGSCCVLWVRNGGTNCPACRGISTNVTTSRILASVLATLLRADPSRQRASGERQQADQVYRPGDSIRIPVPKAPSPEPAVREPENDMYARPCPHCAPNNQYNWRCPVPIIDPSVDRERAFNLEDGVPEGHAFCGNCDLLHAFGAPTSSKCDFCLASFCGITVEDRCRSMRVADQKPHSINSIADLLESGEIYDIFNQNTIEVDRLLDYMREEGVDIVGDVYPDIVNHLMRQPEPFKALYDSGLFDAHVPPPETNNNAAVPHVLPSNTNDSDSDSSDSGSDDEGDLPPPPATTVTTTTTAPTPSQPPSEEGSSQPTIIASATDAAPQPPNEPSPASPASPPSDHGSPRLSTPPPPVPPPAAPAAPPAPAVVAARKRICRSCASEVFFWGLKEWWIRERERVLGKPQTEKSAAEAGASASGSGSGTSGEQEAATATTTEDAEKAAESEPESAPAPAATGILAVLRSLKNCEDGSECTKQGDMSHARAFSHLLSRARLQPTNGEGSNSTTGVQEQNQDAPAASARSTPAFSDDVMDGIVMPQLPQILQVISDAATPMDVDAPALDTTTPTSASAPPPPMEIPLSDVVVEGFLAGAGEVTIASGTTLVGIPPAVVGASPPEVEKQQEAVSTVVNAVTAGAPAA